MKKYIYRYKQRFIFIILISCLIALSKIMLSMMMGKFTNSAVALDKRNLIIFGLLSVVSLMLILLFEKVQLFTINKFIQKCILAVKEDVYESILYSSNMQLHKENNAYYINVVTSELNICFLQVLFHKSCKLKMENIATGISTMLQTQVSIS